MRNIIFAVAILIAAPALAQQCVEPPVLSSPRTCAIPANGGKCAFGFDEDGIVTFPDQAVTGKVVIEGGRNVHVIGGHVELRNGEHFAVGFDSPHNVFVEGMRVDAGGYCDAFAIRNHRTIQTNFTFQNIYVENLGYDVVNQHGGFSGDLDCHGDVIQNQGTSGGGLHLTVENLQAYLPDPAQGFFIPRYGDGAFSATFRNVGVVAGANNWKPLYWFSSPQYGDPAYPVTLENVSAVYNGAGQFWPESRIDNGTYISWPSEALVSGIVERGEMGADFQPFVGLNYDRGWFCSIEAEPLPEPDPALDPAPSPEPEYLTWQDFIDWCNAQRVRRMTCPN